MTAPEPDVPDASVSSLAAVRSLLTHATQHLLGATIELGDDQWRAPSLLPGWSRGHLAAHLARNADGLARLSRWALTGDREEPYSSREARDAAIESGSGRPGLELQVDLDTSAGQLDDAFAELDDADRWDAAIETHGRPTPARLLPLIRLFEVTIHHIDLDVGHTFADLDDELVGWLLEFVPFALQGRDDVPRLELTTDAGQVSVIGPGGAEPRRVTGPGGLLLGWLTGRRGSDGLDGADGLTLPTFG